MLNALVTDLHGKRCAARVAALGATTLAEIRHAPQRLAGLSPQMEAERAAMKGFFTPISTTRRAWRKCTLTRTEVVEGSSRHLMNDPG